MASVSTKKRRLIAGLIASCVAVVALTVTLALTLPTSEPSTSTLAPVTPPEDDVIEPPTPPVTVVQSMGLPVAGEYTVDKNFAKDKLVYCVTQKLWKTHEGVDFKTVRGVPVISVLDGKVTRVGSTTLDGTYVVVTHSDGRVSTYKSLDPDLKVKEGDEITKGTVLGTVSDTMLSEATQGPHLHFELTVDGDSVNPADFITELGGK